MSLVPKREPRDNATTALIGEQIESLTEHPGWERLKELVLEEDQRNDLKLLNFIRHEDDPKQQKLIGVRSGFRQVFEIADKAIRDGRRADEEMSQ